MSGSRWCPRQGLAALLGVLVAVACPVAQTAAPDVSRIIQSARFQEAKAFIRTDHDRFVKELIQLTEIPAPPFKEHRRARAYLAMLQQSGLSDVERDEEGNVMGVRGGSGATSAFADVAPPPGSRSQPALPLEEEKGKQGR